MFTDYLTLDTTGDTPVYRVNRPAVLARVREYFTQEGAQLSKGVLPEADGFSEPMCFYRHPEDQRACGIGTLIADEEYRPDFERKTVSTLLCATAWTRDDPNRQDLLNQHVLDDQHIVLSSDRDWLAHVQGAHDSAQTVEDLLKNLDDLEAGKVSTF